ELAFPFRAQQVVAMGRIPYGDEMRCDALIRDAMLCTDVWHLRHRLYPQLSGGEQQRVQLARVLLQIWQPFQEQPRFLLLDECTSALDPAHQHAVMSVADRFAQQGVAVLAVMHDVALAASWADDIIMLKHGQVLASGGVELLQQAALLQQAYDLEASLASRYAHQNQQWASFNRLPVDRQTA
ncbi:MAG: ATP-binding cassette domain-containing protein, partial [Pseudomonadota bacterium]